MREPISNSNAFLLTGKEWLITIGVFLVLTFGVYTSWYHLERIPVEPDFRSTCWDARMSDYYNYSQWARYAREHYKILLIGDSVIWGQEVDNNQTISHYLNEQLGEEKVANLGIDGLTCAALDGIVTHYGRNLHDTNMIVEINPLWMSSPTRDLRGEWKFHHPRLVPQFNKRITYYKDTNERLGYAIEHILRIPPFVRHLMVNYFDNKSVANWLLEFPYRNPLTAINFQGAPMMKEKQGRGTSWESRIKNKEKWKPVDDPFLEPDESLQFQHFLAALEKLQKRNVNVFVLLGPFNTWNLTPEAKERFFAMMDKVGKKLDDRGIPWFDSTRDLIPSEEYGDNCHALAGGHSVLAAAMAQDAKFREWLNGIK
ncbi:MAG: hypothetical protein ACYC9O_11880 [Candidatus Latescibacterota bacterium]